MAISDGICHSVVHAEKTNECIFDPMTLIQLAEQLSDRLMAILCLAKWQKVAILGRGSSISTLVKIGGDPELVPTRTTQQIFRHTPTALRGRLTPKAPSPATRTRVSAHAGTKLRPALSLPEVVNVLSPHVADRGHALVNERIPPARGCSSRAPAAPWAGVHPVTTRRHRAHSLTENMRRLCGFRRLSTRKSPESFRVPPTRSVAEDNSLSICAPSHKAPAIQPRRLHYRAAGYGTIGTRGLDVRWLNGPALMTCALHFTLFARSWREQSW